MLKVSKFVVGLILATFAGIVAAQSAIIRGEVSAGVYENLITDGAQHLVVNVNSAVSATGLAYTNSTLTVTNASQALLAANASRKFLLLQNNDAAGIVYVTIGATSTSAIGVQLLPGTSWQMTTNAPVGSINLIGSIASNANVIAVSGQ